MFSILGHSNNKREWRSSNISRDVQPNNIKIDTFAAFFPGSLEVEFLVFSLFLLLFLCSFEEHNDRIKIDKKALVFYGKKNDAKWLSCLSCFFSATNILQHRKRKENVGAYVGALWIIWHLMPTNFYGIIFKHSHFVLFLTAMYKKMMASWIIYIPSKMPTTMEIYTHTHTMIINFALNKWHQLKAKKINGDIIVILLVYLRCVLGTFFPFIFLSK